MGFATERSLPNSRDHFIVTANQELKGARNKLSSNQRSTRLEVGMIHSKHQWMGVVSFLEWVGSQPVGVKRLPRPLAPLLLLLWLTQMKARRPRLERKEKKKRQKK